MLWWTLNRYRYPEVGEGQQFLNSALFIGFAADVYKILTDAEHVDGDDQQLFFSNIFLNEKKRKEFNIKIDHRSQLFQNLNDSKEIELVLSGIYFHSPLFYNEWLLMI